MWAEPESPRLAITLSRASATMRRTLSIPGGLMALPQSHEPHTPHTLLAGQEITFSIRTEQNRSQVSVLDLTHHDKMVQGCLQPGLQRQCIVLTILVKNQIYLSRFTMHNATVRVHFIYFTHTP